MEAKASSIAGSLALVIVITWIWKIVVWVWVRPKRLERFLRQQGLKGTSYQFLHGDWEDIKKVSLQAQEQPIGLFDDIRPYALPFHHQIIQKLGKNSFVWNGPIPRVLLMEPQLVKEILFKNSIIQKPAFSPLTRSLICGFISYEGQQWAKHRKLVLPAFHLEKLKRMLPAMYLSCSELVDRWEKLMSESKGSSIDINIWPSISNLTAEIISRTAFGSRYQDGQRIFELQQEQTKIAHPLLQTIYIPGLRFLPTKTNRRMKEIDNEMRSVLMGIIKKREKLMKAGQYRAEDLLGILMESNLREIQESGNMKSAGMSINEVIDECKLFYFAGQETTSILLTWTMIMLSIHQDWQERAREEVVQAFEHKQEPDFDMLNHLKIVSMILHEVSRLYPPVISMTRIAREDVKVGDMNIPAGVELLVPMVLMQRDAEVWGADAMEFKPERFSEGVAKAANHPAALLPFGAGPRICVGQNFTMLEAKMVMAVILKKFRLELSPSYKHAPFPELTFQPRYGAPLILHKI